MFPFFVVVVFIILVLFISLLSIRPPVLPLIFSGRGLEGPGREDIFGKRRTLPAWSSVEAFLLVGAYGHVSRVCIGNGFCGCLSKSVESGKVGRVVSRDFCFPSLYLSLAFCFFLKRCSCFDALSFVSWSPGRDKRCDKA